MPRTGDFLEESHSRRNWIIVKSIPIFLLFIIFLIFKNDVLTTCNYIFTFLFWFFFRQIPAPDFTPEISHSSLIVLYNFFFIFLYFFFIWLWWVSSQALLPVKTIPERLQTALYFILYILGFHGPAVLIRDGRIRTDYDELFRYRPGVVVVDFNSAVVLEKKVYPPGVVRLLLDILFIPKDLYKKVSGHPKQNTYETIRVCGPGVIFTQFGERIRGVGDLVGKDQLETICGVVDLRAQFRINERQISKNPEKIRTKVHGYTRDGIELTTNVWALFTIGENTEPDALQVTYIGERRIENLRVVNIEQLKSGDLLIRGLDDSLDPEDRREIHQYARFADRTNEVTPYHPLPPRADQPVFDRSRVFSAVFSRARTGEDHVIPWNDLPSRVAIDYFRELLSTVNYNLLYEATPADQLQIEELRKKLKTKLRNQGLLSYRVIYPTGKEEIKTGQQFSANQFRVSNIRSLTASKVLRDRGIKMIASGFGDLIPVSAVVYEKQLDSWRATWQRDTVERQAGFELEVVRIQNRARVQAQRELSHCFSQILQKTDISQEVLAIRIFQALEGLATEPTTHQLLPADTINIMRMVHDWLLPGDMGFPTAPPQQRG